ncbi:hypothetical protein TNCV_4073071 [Trichonephila clavipes]|uniref:Uncharacterized protein n=1 Tax=Trichonephila clavipes TaxID=2585209 RepID=A0A8X6W891_TRICX|nr:hypothetical protein TNCV_4073071 [Trichonephila clavipes]
MCKGHDDPTEAKWNCLILCPSQSVCVYEDVICRKESEKGTFSAHWLAGIVVMATREGNIIKIDSRRGTLPFHTSCGKKNHHEPAVEAIYPFLCECTDEGVLVCRRRVSTSNLPPPKHPIHFQWGLDLENALAIRDIEYPRCLDNPEQRVFNDMLRCRP